VSASSDSNGSNGTAPHGPGHLGCPTCDPTGGQPAAGHQRPSVVRVAARGDSFKIIQVVGNLFVCSKANGNCCCGWAEQGRMPFDNTLWSHEWDRRMIRARVHLTFSGCLGPCAIGNNALLQIYGRSIWFKDLNSPAFAPLVFDYIQAMLAVNRVLPVPEALAGHVYERYLTPNDAEPVMSFGQTATPVDPIEALEGLDPVCLMDVDVASAKHKADYDGHTFAFCGPACKKMFNADPAAYLGPAAARTT
jgi:YHS domain-containing protein/(2Fe-2S) ferredoxin